MRPRCFLIIVPAIILAGCASDPGPYPPPQQRSGPEVVKPSRLGSFIAMNDPHADFYVLGGISPTVEAGTWRWTFDRPELQFQLDEAEGWKFVMEFAIAGATFKDTGPVTLAVSVNGTPLDKKRYDAAGTYRLELPVPAAAVRAGELNRVAIQPDKVWPTKDGGALGFILTSAGFQR